MQFEFSNECTMDYVVKCHGCGCVERFEGGSFLELVHATAENEGWDMGNDAECRKAMDATMVEAMRDAGHADCPDEECEGWDAGADADEFHDRLRDMRDE